jgi:mannose/cellobiose epimerase-like protein (N-acyl-D-glucosamine 2-epimerase family)
MGACGASLVRHLASNDTKRGGFSHDFALCGYSCGTVSSLSHQHSLIDRLFCVLRAFVCRDLCPSCAFSLDQTTLTAREKINGFAER